MCISHIYNDFNSDLCTKMRVWLSFPAMLVEAEDNSDHVISGNQSKVELIPVYIYIIEVNMMFRCACLGPCS